MLSTLIRETCKGFCGKVLSIKMFFVVQSMVAVERTQKILTVCSSSLQYIQSEVDGGLASCEQKEGMEVDRAWALIKITRLC